MNLKAKATNWIAGFRNCNQSPVLVYKPWKSHTLAGNKPAIAAIKRAHQQGQKIIYPDQLIQGDVFCLTPNAWWEAQEVYPWKQFIVIVARRNVPNGRTTTFRLHYRRPIVFREVRCA